MPSPSAARYTLVATSLAVLVAAGSAASAQDAHDAEPQRTRVALGAQIFPSYPGAKRVGVGPLFDMARARGDADYAFEAPDEAAGTALFESGGLAFGPVIGFEGSRTADDVGAPVAKVGFTVEPGVFVQYQTQSPIRFRAEARQGIGGHKGLVGTVSADYVMRDGNDWLLSVGPRVTLADDRYHRAYFGVSPGDAAATGLPAYTARGGLQSVGAAVGYVRQLTPRWGIYSYARYERLAGDPADSPLVRRYGSRDQYYAGLALTYTFGRDID